MVVLVSYFKADWFRGFAQFSSPLLFITMFLLALDKDYEKLFHALKNIKALMFTMFFAFIIAPILGIILGKVFFGDPSVLYTSLIVMVCVGGTIAPSIIWTRLSGGNETLSLTIAVVVSILSSIITPVLLSIALGINIHFDVLNMFIMLVEVTILPVVIAQIVRVPLKKYLKGIQPSVTIISRIILLAFIAFATAQSASYIVFQTLIFSIIVVVIHQVAMLFLSFKSTAIVGFKIEDRIALTFASSQNAFIPALVIISSFFSPGMAVIPLIYYICQEIIALNVSRIFKKASE